MLLVMKFWVLNQSHGYCLLLDALFFAFTLCISMKVDLARIQVLISRYFVGTLILNYKNSNWEWWHKSSVFCFHSWHLFQLTITPRPITCWLSCSTFILKIWRLYEIPWAMHLPFKLWQGMTLTLCVFFYYMHSFI